MSIHERDWYREEYASKNGMRYNKSNATYSAQELPVPDSNSVNAAHPALIVKGSPHSSLQLVVWLVAAVAFAAFYRYSR